MDQTVQKRPCGQNDSSGAEKGSHLVDDAPYPTILHYQRFHQGLLQFQIFLEFQSMLHGAAVEHLVVLGARAADRRAFLGIEQTKLDGRAIRHLCHFTTQCVDFLNEVALSDSSHRRRAWHVRDRIQVNGKNQSLTSHAGRSESRFASSMAGSYDYHVISVDHLLKSFALSYNFFDLFVLPMR